jgi:hypothetical protein
LVKGLLSIASGKKFSLEDISEQLRIDEDLIEMCLILSSFTKHLYIEGQVKEMRKAPAFNRFSKRIKIFPDLLHSLITLSYNLVDYSDLIPTFDVLKIRVTFNNCIHDFT